MRPRSKLLSKRRLMLPTITEGNEETVKELNGVNALHNGDQSQAVSSEDYLLSICHLACPTRDVSPDNLHTQQPNAVLRKLRPSQLIRTTLTTFDFNLKEEAQVTLEEQASLMGGNSDPLEYLYGHQNNISMLSGSVRRRFGRQHGGANVADRGRASSINQPGKCFAQRPCYKIKSPVSCSYPFLLYQRCYYF
uniref:Uncharacterized protein n=1 Tax=Oryzias latipes TaxID=8090 RepID=H2LK37_ORYLA